MIGAWLAGVEREIRLLADHREDLLQERTRIQNRLRWYLHDLDPALAIPSRALDRYCWLDRLERVLAACAKPGVEVRIAAALIERSRELTRSVNALERELERLLEAGPRSCSSFAAAAA